MARALSLSISKSFPKTPSRCSSRLVSLRSQSNSPPHHHLNNDVGDDSSTDPLLSKLEDAIHRIIVRRAAPDWLPFIPGSSYWVPPSRSASGSLGIAQLVEKLANPLTDEESLSVTTVRGWPSSDYFVKDAPPHLIEVKVTSGKVEAEKTSSHTSKSEDEEG